MPKRYDREGRGPTSSAIIAELTLRYIEDGQELKQRLRPDVDNASVTINPPNQTATVYILSDLHLFHGASDTSYVNNLMEVLHEAGTYAIVAGDIIQGTTPKYPDTGSQSTLTFREQLLAARHLILAPLVRRKKLLAVVSRYGSHEDWPLNDYDISGPELMLRGLPGAQNIPLICNGGTLNVRIANSDRIIPITLFHSSPGSATTVNPTRGLNNVFAKNKISPDQTDPVIGIAGHHHSLAGVSTQIQRVGDLEIQMVLIQNGTAMGSSSAGLPDNLFAQRGNKPSPSGASFCIRVRPGTKDYQIVPGYGIESSRRLHQAMTTLNKTEADGTTAELLQEIATRLGAGLELILDEQASTQAYRNPSSRGKYRAPLYSQISWRVISASRNLPFCVYTLAHCALGSSESNTRQIQEIVDTAARLPNALLLVLNDILDPTVPKNEKRQVILDQLCQTISVVPVERRAGLMLDSVLRDDQWNKPIVTRREKQKDEIPPIVTGDHIFCDSASKNTPLYEGGATMVFHTNGSKFRWLLVDGVGNFGSRQDPYLALLQMDKLSMTNNNVVTGGNSITPGALTTPSLIAISPGWNSPVRDRRYGKSSMVRVAGGGQGVTMFPDGTIYGSGNLKETTETFHALFLYQGLIDLDLLKKVMSRK